MEKIFIVIIENEAQAAYPHSFVYPTKDAAAKAIKGLDSKAEQISDGVYRTPDYTYYFIYCAEVEK